MQQVTVGPKYQIVIPKQIRKDIKNLKPGNKVNVSKNKKGIITIAPQVEAKDWVKENRGKFKGVWGEDPIGEITKMRAEWDEPDEKSSKSTS